jgi:hypothetical protein
MTAPEPDSLGAALARAEAAEGALARLRVAVEFDVVDLEDLLTDHAGDDLRARAEALAVGLRRRAPRPTVPTPGPGLRPAIDLPASS